MNNIATIIFSNFGFIITKKPFSYFYIFAAKISVNNYHHNNRIGLHNLST